MINRKCYATGAHPSEDHRQNGSVMHSTQDVRRTGPIGPGSDDVAGLALSETAASYLGARLAEGLLAPASAHDHTTVNEPDAAH